MASIGESIHDYIGRGWSIIPIRPGDKRPIVRWEEFQHRCPSAAEAHGWGGFGLVVGVGADEHAADLRATGADVVVADLGEIRIEGRREPMAVQM